MCRFVLAAVVLCALGAPAFAEYPDRSIRLIVPQAAGANSDLYARLVGAEMGKSLGQQIVVENRPGGAFAIGLDAIAKAAPDGYTMGIGLIGGMALTPHMLAKVPYDIENDFVPVGMIARGYLILAISPQLQVGSVQELIDLAKKNPGKLTVASSGTGSPGHVGAELFKYMTGTQITHVSYRGGAPAINDLMAGRVDMMFEGLASMAPFILDGRLRAVGISGEKRSAAFPNVPTIQEAGVPGYVDVTWLGIVVPAKTPRPLVDRLNKALNEALRSQLITDRMKLIGEDAAPGTPEEYASVIKADSAKWKAVIERAGIKLQE
ncbi:MAG: tripartite tricarboxylate transporter substrate binding protein [Pseudolabrys sp.]|nr:tripartite tricarboxylate transporter substrate binding protein [Pseudolabrys sp.]MBV9260532.1 tripartite tricarboxylate transporter substrate binding protein [Pseudolabrys sp.]